MTGSKSNIFRLLPGPVQIVASVLLGVSTLLVLGFFVFFGIVATQKPESPDSVADLAVVLTGGTGRVETGFRLLLDGHAKALLISGAHPDTSLDQLIELWSGTRQEKAFLRAHCCITLDHRAQSTETNAAETAAWIKAKADTIQTLRIVTSAYHMPRAWILFRRALPEKTLLIWPVEADSPGGTAFWRNLLSEYTKTLLTWMT